MPDSAPDLFALSPAGHGRWQVVVPEGWAQGRGAFGGLVVGWMTRAAEAAEVDSERTVRTLCAHIVGPVQVGPATLVVEPLREGSGVSTRAVKLLQPTRNGAEELLAHAVVSLGRRRVADRDFTRGSAPQAPAASSLDVAPIAPPLGPEFAQNLEFRPVRGVPMSAPGEASSGGATTLGHVRSRTPPKRVDAAYLAAIADAYWPSIYVTEEALRPMATLAFTLDLVSDPAALDPEQAFLIETRALAARDGFVVEDRSIFSADGTLVALNRQTFVIIK
jgi:acyl-CoA thioesterase